MLSGAAQGSPLSPLLYVAAVQPLAARLRQLQAAGAVAGIRLPGGRLAPPCHQHADDTTLHTATAADAAEALRLAVLPFCRASASALNLNKSKGMTLGSHPPLQGPHAPSGVPFVAPGTRVRHLGILLTTGSRAVAAAEMWQALVGAVAARVQHWRGIDLTHPGRVHVARQILAAAQVYTATVVPPPKPQLRAMQGLIDGFVAGGGGGSAAADACRPLRARPGAAVAALPLEEGGAAAVCVELHGLALRAKVAARQGVAASCSQLL